MKIFEYMAMGKALVAPDLEVLREVLRPGANALLVERGDAGALAAAIRRLAGDPALRRTLGTAARQDAIERHDWRHHAHVIAELAVAAQAERAQRGRAGRRGGTGRRGGAARAELTVGPHAGIARALMRLGAAEPAIDDLSLGEIFNHPAFTEATVPEQRARLAASAAYRRADERSYPLDRYFGHDLAPFLGGTTVLDLGCFTGGRSAAWIERYRLARLVGVDVDPRIVAGARRFAAAEGLSAHFASAVGEALPFADSTFDAILSFDVFEHVQDLERVLSECRRVLKPGGRLYAVFPSYWHPTEHHLGLVTRTPCLHWFFSGRDLVRAYDAIAGERGPRAAWYRRSSPELEAWECGHTVNGTTRARFAASARRAGFETVAMPLVPLFTVGRAVGRRPLLRACGPVCAALARIPGLRELAIHRIVAILARPAAAPGRAGAISSAIGAASLT
jgi:SAM-dependent methyltransferase